MKRTLAVQVIAAIMPIISLHAAAVDTVESVTTEITDLQNKFDSILYPAYYKDL